MVKELKKVLFVTKEEKNRQLFSEFFIDVNNTTKEPFALCFYNFYLLFNM